MEDREHCIGYHYNGENYDYEYDHSYDTIKKRKNDFNKYIYFVDNWLPEPDAYKFHKISVIANDDDECYELLKNYINKVDFNVILMKNIKQSLKYKLAPDAGIYSHVIY